MNDTLTLPSPAKLNLMLHITGRRANGYHDLQTLFQLLDYGDSLTFEARNDGEITLETDMTGLPVEENLIFKAAVRLKNETGTKKGIHIRVNKRLPMGGGLGGGSSNAATTLVGLNHFWQTGLNLHELADLGLSLGADVPVFVLGNSAWGEGVGEVLTPVELKEQWFVVLHPGIHVNTGEVFNHPDLTRNTPITTIRNALATGGHNDCETVVRTLHPEIDRGIKWLSRFGDARLTGTGACFYVSVDSESKASRILSEAPEMLNGFIAKAQNRSPLHSSLGIT